MIKIKVITKIIYISERRIHIAELRDEASTKTRQLYWITIQKQLFIHVWYTLKILKFTYAQGSFRVGRTFIRSILTQNPEIHYVNIASQKPNTNTIRIGSTQTAKHVTKHMFCIILLQRNSILSKVIYCQMSYLNIFQQLN